MEQAQELRIPLLNPNETEALIAGLHVAEGQQIKPGDLLYTLETTKSTADVEAEGEGYLVGIQVEEGETVSAGDLFAYLAASPDWQPPEKPAEEPQPDAPPADLRITDPALALAKAHDLDLASLPGGILVTESVVRDTLADQGAEPKEANPTAAIIYGGSGHGKSVLDLMRSLDSYELTGFIDDGIPPGREILGLAVLGGAEVLPKVYRDGTRLAVNAVGGIGNVGIRVRVFERLVLAGFTCPAVVHPTAFVEPSARLADGVQVFPHAYIGSDCRVGFGTIVNTGAIISHDCILDDYVNIAPGAILAGGVQVSERSLVGMGVTVNLNVKVGAGAQIGNGATVKADVPEGGIVRAGAVWPE